MFDWKAPLTRTPSVAVLRLEGTIGAGRRSLSDAALRAPIERAFRKGKPVAVALQINSPGGSAVQSSLIAGRIRRLADETETQVLAFVEDVAASGGYWLASAADEIFVDPASIVGSIGVIAAGFGLADFIGRHGVERRVHTAGTSKSFLDPFRPEAPEDVARLEGLLTEMHQVFIDQIKARRGAKLADNDDLFTGAFWSGARAVELGLADGIGHMAPVLKERFGEKLKLRPQMRKRPMLQRFGMTLVDDLGASFEERAAFARFGL